MTLLLYLKDTVVVHHTESVLFVLCEQDMMINKLLSVIIWRMYVRKVRSFRR